MKVNKSCYVYPKMGFYWIINIPYFVLLILVTGYLGHFNIPVAVTYISLYLVSLVLHGYVCAFSECPHRGTMCPGAFGYAPVGKIAGWIQEFGIYKSTSLVNLFFMTILICLLGIVLLPIYWIAYLGALYGIGYIAAIAVYFITFLITICPQCGNQDACPMAKLSGKLRR